MSRRRWFRRSRPVRVHIEARGIDWAKLMPPELVERLAQVNRQAAEQVSRKARSMSAEQLEELRRENLRRALADNPPMSFDEWKAANRPASDEASDFLARQVASEVDADVCGERVDPTSEQHGGREERVRRVVGLWLDYVDGLARDAVHQPVRVEPAHEGDAAEPAPPLPDGAASAVIGQLDPDMGGDQVDAIGENADHLDQARDICGLLEDGLARMRAAGPRDVVVDDLGAVGVDAHGRDATDPPSPLPDDAQKAIVIARGLPVYPLFDLDLEDEAGRYFREALCLYVSARSVALTLADFVEADARTSTDVLDDLAAGSGLSKKWMGEA